jgi:Ion transport protein
MSRESLSASPASSDFPNSPYPSVRSDTTLDDYYFAHAGDLVGRSPRDNVSSPLEYSDESEDNRRISAEGGGRKNYHSRAPVLDNASSTFQIPPKTSSGMTSFSLFRNFYQVPSEPAPSKSRTALSNAADEDMRQSLRGSRNHPRKTAKSSSHRNSHSRVSASNVEPNVVVDSDDSNMNWMARWAYSSRSPVDIAKKTHDVPPPPTIEEKKHRRQGSHVLEEYPHYVGLGEMQPDLKSTRMHPPPPSPFEPWKYTNQPISRGSITNEDSPLLLVPFSSYGQYSTGSNDEDLSTLRVKSRNDFDTYKKNRPASSPSPNTLAAKFAAALLQDYEASRPPTFVNLADISEHQMTLYYVKHSAIAGICRFLATLAIFASSFMEGFYDVLDIPVHHRAILTALNLFAVTVLVFDVWLLRKLRGSQTTLQNQRDPLSSLSASTRTLLEKHQVRVSRSEKLIQPLIFFCGLLALETVLRIVVVSNGKLVLLSSILKPLALFYVSSQARDAFESVLRILRIILRVLLMELLLILMFATAACRLFHQYESFHSLGAAWVSLFELATTVVNPSIWMPVYNDSRISALFFIFFVVVTVFYLHSLVLSVVFQTFIQAASDVHERNSADKEDAVYLAFVALANVDRSGMKTRESKINHVYVDIQSVRQTLRILRPHYNTMKINALIEIVDPSSQGTVDYTTFRTKIRQALNASIRTVRNASKLAMSVELIAAFVAITNFIYVILVSTEANADWFAAIQVELGCFITLIAAFELTVRFNPLRIPDLTPLTRLNSLFDGSALVAAFISAYGIILYLSGEPSAFDYILVGRSLDMIRSLRFFQIFRDVCRRTSDVLPALMGPFILVLSTIHVFTYVGMAIWGGSIEVGAHPSEIVDYYDLNNFNSYQEGTVTMFQILTVNDWYAIAVVFLMADRNSSQVIVYLFFIVANLTCVSIMLNVLTAFFAGSFVTKLHDDTDAPAEATSTLQKESGGILVESEVKKMISSRIVGEHGDDSASEGTTESERFEFDVFERQGFDKIMETVAGSSYHGDNARDICNYLEIYESLAPGRETVGYLVCDQQTLERFGNRRFRSKAIGSLDENSLHSAVTEMHAELLSLAPRSTFQDRSLVRRFPYKREPGKFLEISAALLRRHPALSLFVSRTIAGE